MSRIQTRALVEGAIFAAITVVIGILKFYIPIIAMISIVWSVPTILIAFRHGFKVSIISVIVSSLLVAIITQPIEGLGFLIAFGLPGVFMGYLLKKKVSPEKTILLTSIVLSICSVIGLYMSMLAVGVNLTKVYDQIFNEMETAYKEAMNSIVSMYSTMGVNREELMKGTEVFGQSMAIIKLILPGGILISGALMSFINFKLTKIVLKRINYFIEDVKPFSLWRLSNNSMFFVLTMIMLIVVELYFIKLPQLYALTMNFFTIAMMLFVVLGLSVAKFFLDKYKVPKGVKGILLFFLVLVFSNITAFIGVLDMPFDFRKLQNKPAEDV